MRRPIRLSLRFFLGAVFFAAIVFFFVGILRERYLNSNTYQIAQLRYAIRDARELQIAHASYFYVVSNPSLLNTLSDESYWPSDCTFSMLTPIQSDGSSHFLIQIVDIERNAIWFSFNENRIYIEGQEGDKSFQPLCDRISQILSTEHQQRREYETTDQLLGLFGEGVQQGQGLGLHMRNTPGSLPSEKSRGSEK